MTHKIEIKGKLSGYGTEVYLDGEELHGVRSLTFSVGMDRVTTARIEMIADVEIESEAEVKICSLSETIDNLVLNRENEDLFKFGDKLLEEMNNRREKKWGKTCQQ